MDRTPKHSPADEAGEQYKFASHLEGERGAEYFERVYTGRFDSVFERRAVTLDESTACACAMHALQGTPSILFEWDEDLCALRVIGGVVRGGETLPVRITGWSRTSTASALAPFAKVGTEVRRLGAMHRRAKAHRDDDALVHFYGTVEWALSFNAILLWMRSQHRAKCLASFSYLNVLLPCGVC